MFAPNRSHDASSFSQLLERRQQHAKQKQAQAQTKPIRPLTPSSSAPHRTPTPLVGFAVPRKPTNPKPTDPMPTSSTPTTSAPTTSTPTTSTPANRPPTPSQPSTGRLSGPLHHMPAVLRSRGERGPADHRPSAANTSRRLKEVEPTSRRRRQEAGMERNLTLKCGKCTKSLEEKPRHQCRICPHVQYCLSCSIDAEVLHPDHTFELVRAGRHVRHIKVAEQLPKATIDELGIQMGTSTGIEERRTPQATDEGPGTTATARASDGVKERPMPEDGRESDQTDGESLGECSFRLPHCASCQDVLADLRYECQDCHDTNFCSDCRTTHYLDHTLQICTGPVGKSDSSSGELDGEDVEDSHVFSDEDLASTGLAWGAGIVGTNNNESVEGTGNSTVGKRKARDDDLELEHREDGIGTGSNDEPQETSQHEGRAGNDAEDVDLTIALRRTVYPRSGSSSAGPIEVTYTDFAQMTAAMTRAMNNMQTMVRAAEQILQAHGSSRNATESRVRLPRNMTISGADDTTQNSSFVPKTLFGVPVELATLDNDDSELDDACSGSEEADKKGEPSIKRRKSRHAPRHWTAEDQQQLRNMKKKGWTDERIARALKRSPGAISQQWRKQKQ